MKMTMDELIVFHCSPTLAMLKPACMFSCSCKEYPDLDQQLTIQNQRLNQKGIHLHILLKRSNDYLIMVYHQSLLFRHLQDQKIKHFLQGFGYVYTNEIEALEILSSHMIKEDFPHEVGAFLGYPLNDVISFIENEGKNYKCLGYWKVYHNCQKANQEFECFTACIHRFMKMLHDGDLLENLVYA